MAGNTRFARLKRAVDNQEAGPPPDMRFLNRPKARTDGDAPIAKVSSFLEGIYHSVAETLPDVVDLKDDAGVEYTCHTDGSCDPPDGYAAILGAGIRKPVLKVRRKKKGLQLHPERTHHREIRFLPPGTIKDYYEQFCASEQCRISFRAFWKCWNTEFSFLRFRPTSSHAQCGVCCHHKVMMKELSRFILARKRQAKLYHHHLLSQYRDRQKYWEMRASSRLQVQGHLTLILDGMDQMKFQFPRSPYSQAKDLSLMMRPKLHIVGLILHGLMVMFAICDHDHPKDSSVMSELLCHALTLAGRRVKLSDHHIHVVSDNTTRETKNNTTLRLIASLTIHGKIMGGSLRNLRSGHSHEDIDQLFGGLGFFLIKHAKTVQTPNGFISIVERFCNSCHRPHEPERVVVKLDQHRDWFLDGE